MKPPLLRRFPRLRYDPPLDRILPQDAPAQMPALAADLGEVEQTVQPAFAQADRAALLAQNRFRGLQVLVIALSALAALFGAIQAAVGDAAGWPGTVQGVVALVAGAVVIRGAAESAHRKYLEQRLRAERLRAEAFLFLGRVGYPSDDAGARQHLATRVRALAGV